MKRLKLDFRYALRTFAKSPGFTAVAVLTLALGIGANGAVSSVLRALLLRPLPYSQPESLVMVWSRWTDFAKTWISVPEQRAYQEAGCFSELALFQPGQANLTGGSEPERVGSALVSANVFDVLGIKPLLGRVFVPGEVSAQPAKVVLLSEELWRRRFGADPQVVGRSIDVNGGPLTVVGVIPAGFKLPLDYNSQTPSALWLPLDEELTGPYSMPPGGGEHNYNAVGRLAPGVSLAQARARLQGVADRYTAEGTLPREWHFEPLVVPLIAEILGPLRIGLLILFGAVGLVLLIACANVANLLLVRGLQRRKEFTVRMALGASRGQLVRQLLTEGVVLALVGGALGLWLGYLGVRGILLANPTEIPRVGEIGMDSTVVAFMALVSLATAVVFGLAPALRFSRPDLQTTLREGGRSSAGGGSDTGRFQSLTVVVEVALAVILLMGASLMVRTFWSLSRVDPGFRAANVLTLGLSPSVLKYPQAEAQIHLYDEILEGVRRLPGVRSAGAVRNLPLATDLGDTGLLVEGYSPPPGQKARADWQVVTPGYFETLGIPLVAGRLFTAADRRDAQSVMVVSEAMAKKFWPGGSPLGHRVKVGSPKSPWSTVVGVVGDVRHQNLTADVKQTWYLPIAQFDLSTGFQVPGMTLVVRTAGAPQALATPVRAAIRAVDPQLPASDVRPLEEVTAGAISKQRFLMFFLVFCSALALLLAAVGVYGVIRFRVGTRRREIGLRMALGARAGQVVSDVVLQGMTLVAVGLVIGIGAALGLTRFLSSLLYGVGAHDPLTFLAAALVLGLVALGATYFPARRAARVDPLVVLRDE